MVAVRRNGVAFKTFKFVLGIKDKDVREAILRSDMASYNFQGLVDFAVSLGCSLSFCVKGGEGEVEAGLVQVSKQYYKIAKKSMTGLQPSRLTDRQKT